MPFARSAATVSTNRIVRAQLGPHVDADRPGDAFE